MMALAPAGVLAFVALLLTLYIQARMGGAQ